MDISISIFVKRELKKVQLQTTEFGDEVKLSILFGGEPTDVVIVDKYKLFNALKHFIEGEEV